LNALGALGYRLARPAGEDALKAIVEALQNPAHCFHGGTTRADMRRMLDAAAKWAAKAGKPLAWREVEVLPTARAFWDDLGKWLGAGVTRRTAIVGFGEDTAGRRRGWYDDHWTVARRVGSRFVSLVDSGPYGSRLARSHTGVKPEPGWLVDEAFFLRVR
jgi:hypothetical protein